MENPPPNSIPFWFETDPIMIDTPIHFQIRMGRGNPDILLSVDGSGRHGWKSMWRDPDILVPIGRSGKRGEDYNLYVDFMTSFVKPPCLDIIANCLSSPCMFTFHRNDWGITFYIRVDLAGLYHAYPQVDGGPFKTLEDAYRAIDLDLKRHRVPEMSMRQPNDSQVDYVVRQCLHWPDGTRKKRLKSGPIDVIRDQKRHLVQALVDKYNDYLGDTAYVLKDVVQCTTVRVRDCYKITYHINFTARAKGTEDSDCSMDDLFFAEVTSMTGDKKSVVSCFCRVKATDNGGCYGCNAKHPNGPVYSCGVEGACFPFGGPDINHQYVDEDLEAEERRVRRYYKDQGLDNPGYFEKLRAIMAGLPVVN